MLLVLLAGSASAKKFDHVPDLDELVKRPIKGTYILVCKKEVVLAEAGGYQVLSSNTTLTGFRSLELVLMVQPGRDWDKIATKLLVHLCIEEDTTYKIVSERDTPILRDTDPGNEMGGDKRSFIPQKTRQ